VFCDEGGEEKEKRQRIKHDWGALEWGETRWHDSKEKKPEENNVLGPGGEKNCEGQRPRSGKNPTVRGPQRDEVKRM